jgi:hypothetical protein
MIENMKYKSGKEKIMTYKKYILAVLVGLLLQGCVANKLSDGDVLGKAISQCSNPEVSIIRIPSRGLLADTLMAQSVNTTHNDGGFLREFVHLINSGANNIAVECPSQQKMEAIVINSLAGIKDDKLKGISLCLIGMSESEKINSEALRTGVTLRIVK